MNTETRSAGSGMSQPAERQIERTAICGVTRVIGRTEWICDLKPHEAPPQLLPGCVDDPAERHRFVNRYPWRASA